LAYISHLLSDVIQYFFQLTGSYGWAIIIVSTILRIVVAPVQHVQMVQAKRTKGIEPLRKAIEKRYKGEPKRIQEETMRLYKTHNIKPLASCLPLLIQLPIVWAFFGALRDLTYTGATSFWWIADLGQPDPWILPVLAGATTFIQSKLTMPPTEGDTTSSTLLYMMPLLILWMSRSFAAGLSLYWVASNVLSIVQQLIYPAGGRSRPLPKEAAS
jgi:YidC/Oxa1 family membrane protein insertase